jgi:hypothetical protein
LSDELEEDELLLLDEDEDDSPRMKREPSMSIPP